MTPVRTILIELPSGQGLGLEVDLPGAPLVLARGSRGFVMCGFLDVRSADKLGAAAAVVRGVRDVGELLDRPVTDVSAAAAALGVRVGQSGREALQSLL